MQTRLNLIQFSCEYIHVDIHSKSTMAQDHGDGMAPNTRSGQHPDTTTTGSHYLSRFVHMTELPCLNSTSRGITRTVLRTISQLSPQSATLGMLYADQTQHTFQEQRDDVHAHPIAWVDGVYHYPNL